MDESVRSAPTVDAAILPVDLPKPRPSARPARVLAMPEAAAPSDSGSAKTPSMAWEAHYRAWVIASDIFATLLVIAIGAGVIGKYQPHDMHVLGTIAAVMCALPASRAWSQRVLGEGAEEYRRLGRGLVTSAVLVALGGLMFGALDVQPWVFFVVPGIAAVAFPQRYFLRQLLHRQRRHGRCLLPVMAAGSPDTLADLIGRTRAEPYVGWRVEAVCTTIGSDQDSGEVDGVPVVGGLDELAAHVRRGGYRVVAVTADQYWSPRRLQQLAWDLEGTSAEMVVAPVLMEVAGPRLNVSGVLGMPLLRVTAPRFTGGRRLVKEAVDRLASAAMLTLFSPLLLVIAVAIKVNDRGPVIYRQRRVGRDGDTFTMLKFRTMITDADKVRRELEAENEAAGPLFKMRKDPRITRVGSLLRRYSLDELPQLLNVLSGKMSLVGPRPPLPEETEKYAPAARRRLLVKPGLTGLWQVSGRSDLTWDQSIRLDLRYVEDWSLALDMVILWKTFRAVVGGEGAY
ncbi:MAG: glycosyl transferase [Amycolatopsis sp.]|jgi:exopolysaccharide biosynthesis polyprenyl glycosylphosphotransferase|uniref:sugar transferase n=1 Tax=Amycolatopsis sp. TaxID=37632 RepID=UPI0026254A41|nr:sugar transferase [Amycolatopsis sp.]MCU1681072.1 glycosyl transferase [Amycolatopsis sp.]